MSQSVDDGYETVELTDNQIERFLDGEKVDLGEYTWSYRSGSEVDIMTLESQVQDAFDNQEHLSLHWHERNFEVVYDPDDDDTESAMDFSGVDQPHTNTDMKTIDDADRETVTMEVTMDISDMDDTDKEVICELARQYEDSFEEICEKNRDYGFSFLTSGAKLAQSSGTVFENHVRSQVDGLLHRSGDKRERLIENVYGEGSSVVSDEPAVTARENANYYQFMSLVLANPQLAKKASDN
jgi:hypothetical protein